MQSPPFSQNVLLYHTLLVVTILQYIDREMKDGGSGCSIQLLCMGYMRYTHCNTVGEGAACWFLAIRLA